MSLFTLFFEKVMFSIWRHWHEQSFRDYVRLNCNYESKKGRQDKNKIPLDIIWRVRAVKIHN